MSIFIFLVAVLVICLLAAYKIVSLAWNSSLFWILALAATLVLFPVTAGMSPAALILLVAIRLVLLGRLISSPK